MKLAIVLSLIGLTCVTVDAQATNPKKATPKPTTLSPKPKAGVVSGRVFAITAGGDIKPARLARVFILDNSGAIVTAWYDELHLASVEYEAQVKADLNLGQHRYYSAKDDKNVEDENWQNLRISVLDIATPSEKDQLIAVAEDDLDAQSALGHELVSIERLLVGNNNRWSDEIICRRELLNYDKALIGARKWRWEHKEWNKFLSAQADEEGQFRIVVPRSGSYFLIVRGRAGFNEAFWSADVTVATGVEAVVKLGQPKKACEVMP